MNRALRVIGGASAFGALFGGLLLGVRGLPPAGDPRLPGGDPRIAPLYRKGRRGEPARSTS